MPRIAKEFFCCAEWAPLSLRLRTRIVSLINKMGWKREKEVHPKIKIQDLVCYPNEVLQYFVKL